MARGLSKPASSKGVEALKHDTASRRNIPTAEYQSLAERLEETRPQEPARLPRARPLPEGETRERDADRDPQIIWNGARIRVSKEQARQLMETGVVEIGDSQLAWRGKDRQDWSDLVVPTPPIYVQEKVHPKAIIDDLKRRPKENSDAPDLFADFNGLDDPEARTEFYQHDQHWSNRMILGDSLAVMASLAEREALRGKVQCIYFDPPYGIKFNSNWQVSTLSRDVRDGKQTDVSREPEQIKAFRDTWKDGIHSYLTYLRERLMVARELLTESGSIFVQIGDENLAPVKSLISEVFGDDSYVVTIAIKKKGSTLISESVFDFVIWYCRSRDRLKLRRLARIRKDADEDDKFNTLVSPDGELLRVTGIDPDTVGELRHNGWRWARVNYPIVSQHPHERRSIDYLYHGALKTCGSNRQWSFDNPNGLRRLERADRLYDAGGASLAGVVFHEDRPSVALTNLWDDVKGEESPTYVVQTTWRIIQRCILLSTDPGDLVFDPTCGSGTTAYVAEQWGRRWITIDTSRVALALARTRLMSARYPFYLLADSPDGRRKEQEVTGKILLDAPTHNDVRQGFVYERAPHVTLKSIANNAEIDVIYDTWQVILEPLRATLNAALGRSYEDWQIPREARDRWSAESVTAHAAAREGVAAELADGKAKAALARLNALLGRRYTFETLPAEPYDPWPAKAAEAHAKWWEGRIARQKEIDASIARAADVEMLYDRPYEDKGKVRVAGPFTVESLSPHRVVPGDEEELIDLIDADDGLRRRLQKVMPPTDFTALVLENLKAAGVHQSEKRDAIRFTALTPWPGEYVAAEGGFMEAGAERRAAIFIGPEFGTATRGDLVAAAREAIDARFDALIACAFAFDAHASEVTKLGPLPILKAKMNPDLHMAGELKTNGKGNLFVVFGEPDIDIAHEKDGRLRVRVKGVDVYDPNTGEIRSNDVKGVAAWFIDDDYNEESFFVRHAYFLGANDPYKSLRAALRADIDEDAWATLYSAESRPFARPKAGKIAVKLINHFGDEVMKVFRV
jgi:adenine-specific DNA-methyltransferase